MLKNTHSLYRDIIPLYDKYPSGLFSRLDIKNGIIDICGIEHDINKIEELPHYKRNRLIDFYHSIKRYNANGTLYFDMDDCRQSNAGEIFFGCQMNIFQYNRQSNDDSAILWRLNSYYEPSDRIGHVKHRIEDEIRFHDKIPKIFWRGALSGSRYIEPFMRSGVYSINTIEALMLNAPFFSRIKSVVFSKNNNSYTDFKLSCNRSKERIPGLQEAGLWDDPVTPAEMTKYKYILCPNGNDVSTNLYWILSTNSLAFREDGKHECLPDYFIKPWVHYVPVSAGLDDLHEKYLWCERNPLMCIKIIENANLAFMKMTDENYWQANEMIVLDRLGLL